MTRETFHPSVRKKSPPVYHMTVHCKNSSELAPLQMVPSQSSALSGGDNIETDSGNIGIDCALARDMNDGQEQEYLKDISNGHLEKEKNDLDQDADRGASGGENGKQQRQQKRHWLVQVKGLKGIKKKI